MTTRIIITCVCEHQCRCWHGAAFERIPTGCLVPITAEEIQAPYLYPQVSWTHSRQIFHRTEVIHKVRVEADGRHCSLKDVVRLICGPDDIIRKGEYRPKERTVAQRKEGNRKTILSRAQRAADSALYGSLRFVRS